ncbi:sugar phosphate isomerase/epimerase [Clostridioides mangenotii]|uniref:sugar phosphate isomerase/epimerase family protein n=1 Tax=Metaclostridioides mangenotii TaxID=1540 RepID=UPI00214A0E45|nr:sugar phosphate isomerase/epimerase [Clostridioides mangenotii]MCR1954036.1 sugar phosphate isomerase/epimerase [Clostridioides mangenotii]
MKIGISALVYDIDLALTICKQYENITHLEIGVDSISDCKKLNTYTDKIYDLGLSIGIHMPMELNACEEVDYIRMSWIKFFEDIYNELQKLDVRYYNFHLGYAITNRLEKNRMKYLDNCIDFFNNINIDSKITLENTYSKGGDLSNIGTTYNDFEYIFKGIKKDGVFFCYDTGHNLINRSNYIENLMAKIRLIHLSDNDGLNDQHIGIGEGLLKDEQIKRILEINPEYLILEINKEDLVYSIDRLIGFI